MLWIFWCQLNFCFEPHSPLEKLPQPPLGVDYHPSPLDSYFWYHPPLELVYQVAILLLWLLILWLLGPILLILWLLCLLMCLVLILSLVFHCTTLWLYFLMLLIACLFWFYLAIDIFLWRIKLDCFPLCLSFLPFILQNCSISLRLDQHTNLVYHDQIISFFWLPLEYTGLLLYQVVLMRLHWSQIFLSIPHRLINLDWFTKLISYWCSLLLLILVYTMLLLGILYRFHSVLK